MNPKKEIYLLKLENKILKETAIEKNIEMKSLIKKNKLLEENLKMKSDELKFLHNQQQLQSIVNELNVQDLSSNGLLRELLDHSLDRYNQLTQENIILQKTVDRREYEIEQLLKRIIEMKSELAEVKAKLLKEQIQPLSDEEEIGILYESNSSTASTSNQLSRSSDEWKKNVYAKCLTKAEKGEKKFEIHLGETKEAVIEGLSEIRKFINEDAELKNLVITDRVIMFFLRSNKFRFEKVKKKIKSFYIHRLEIDEWFINRDPFLTKINELLACGVFLPIIEKDEFRRQIVILRIAAHNPKVHIQNDVMKTSLMVLDWLTFNDETISIYGIRAIFDMKNVTLGHALQMTPTIIKRAVQLMDSYPTRIQQLHFVNSHRGINIVLDIFKKFMPQKLQTRIVVTRENPEFKASDNLPTDLGGVNKSYKELADYWKKKLEKNHLWFNENIDHV